MSTQLTIDLRSDTVTKPSPEMLDAMRNAPVGDDVFGEDPTVNLLQNKMADIFGKEAALFVSSGTMGNQLCLRTHTEPGDEVICDYYSHIFNYESGAAGNLSQVQLHPLHGEHGILTVDQIRDAVRGKPYWNPWTKLIELENTGNKAGGTIYPIERIKEISEFAKSRNLKMHLDGARIWNAHIATGVSLHEYGKHFDSLSVCFSKGLGAPVGSVILGTKDFILKAHRFRKMWGGGMRQIGGLAAACLFAYENNLSGLKQDHDHAGKIAGLLNSMKGFSVDLKTVQSNIVMADVSATGKTTEAVTEIFKQNQILISPFSDKIIRFVTHLDFTSAQMIEFASRLEKIKTQI